MDPRERPLRLDRGEDKVRCRKCSIVKIDELIAGLPGEALMRNALADFQAGRCTVPACLISIARTRLGRAGLIFVTTSAPIPEPERKLYQLLRLEGGDAYSRYNSLLRELVSFENALDHRQRKNSATS
jgi:hypothetical protein